MCSTWKPEDGPPTLGQLLIFASRLPPSTPDEDAEDFVSNVVGHDLQPLKGKVREDLKNAYIMWVEVTNKDVTRQVYEEAGLAPEQVTFTVDSKHWWKLQLWVPGTVADALCGPSRTNAD